jgi:hypothetical protein
MGRGIMKGILLRKYELLFESAKPVHVYNIMRLRPYPPLDVIFLPLKGVKKDVIFLPLKGVKKAAVAKRTATFH